MSKLNLGSSGIPTMIIPKGTQVEVDEHNQLCVRTPGNLVIQNSGTYGHLESVSGSIRIEPNVQVEAVSIRCAEACFVQGTLTAWKVEAKEIHLESTAQAHIVLQETERLEIGKNARLVGNFDSEKELFLLFSRFARQFRGMPVPFERSEPPRKISAVSPEGEPAEITDVEWSESNGRQGGDGLPDDLFFALVMLERDVGNTTYGPTSQRILREIVKLLQERDIETLRHTHQSLFERIVEPGEDVVRARELIQTHFAA